MIRRAWYQWHLTSDEAYLKMLQAEGWTEYELAALRKKCQALRVNVATAPPLDREDRIVLWACAMCAIAMGVILKWL